MQRVNGETASASKELGNCFCSCPVFCCTDLHGVAMCRSADCRSAVQPLQQVQWDVLLEGSRVCVDQAAVACRRRRRRKEDDIQRRAERAEALVHGRVVFSSPRTGRGRSGARDE